MWSKCKDIENHNFYEPKELTFQDQKAGPPSQGRASSLGRANTEGTKVGWMAGRCGRLKLPLRAADQAQLHWQLGNGMLLYLPKETEDGKDTK